jgi:N-acetylneuraminate synthase
MNDRVFVIAEGGVNHNGSLPRALAMVDAAAKAGADAVKFQTFRAEKLVTLDAAKTPYQQQALGNTASQHDMLKALELDEAAHRSLARASADAGIEFMSTAFDLDSLAFLLDEIGIRRVKIPSGEITNPHLLLAAGLSGRPILVSTGMASLAEIEAALGVIAFGADESGEAPSPAAFDAAWWRQKQVLRQSVTILQCTTAYPAPAEDINLRAMDTFAESFGLPVGFSDHSLGTAIAVAAAGRGAKVIEKHFTMDRTLTGPDHAASLEVDELTRMVADIRIVEKSIGSGEKARRPSEFDNVALARRGVYAARDIAAGEVVSDADIVLLRPETTMSPMALWDILGKPAKRAFRKYRPIES